MPTNSAAPHDSQSSSTASRPPAAPRPASSACISAQPEYNPTYGGAPATPAHIISAPAERAHAPASQTANQDGATATEDDGAAASGVAKKQLPAALLARLKKRGIVRDAGGGAAAAEPAATRGETGEAGGAAAQELPLGWQEAFDTTYNHPYWFNASTGERSWVRPGAAAPSGAPADTAEAGGAAEDEAPLPPGWKAAQDPRTGITYYSNRALNVTQWTRPEGPAAVAASGAPADLALDADGDANFLAASAFKGAKPGYVFKKGTAGLGYYRDDDAGRDASGTGRAAAADPAVKRKRVLPIEQQAKRHQKRGTSSFHDPMDPSSYSDAPKGGWSIGLEAAKR